MRVRVFVLSFALANISYSGVQYAMTAQSEPQPSILSGEDLMRILPGNTLLSYDESGPFWLYYPGSETVWGQSSAGDVDIGRWWIEDGRYCRAWRSWHDGATQCWSLAGDGADRIFWLEGSAVRGESRVRPGNAIGQAAPSLLVSLAPDVVADPPTVADAIGPGEPTAAFDRGSRHTGLQPNGGDSLGNTSDGDSPGGAKSGTGSSNGDDSKSSDGEGNGNSSGGTKSGSSGGTSNGGSNSDPGDGSAGGNSSNGSDSEVGDSGGTGGSSSGAEGSSDNGKNEKGGKGKSGKGGSKSDRSDKSGGSNGKGGRKN